MELNYTAGDGQIRDFSPIPVPEVVAMVTHTEMKPTLNKGKQLCLTWTVTQPEQYAGRLVFGNLNLECPKSATAEKIARAELDTICRAIGLTHVSDSTDLHDKQAVLVLDIEPPSVNPTTGQQYKAKNVIKNYKALGAEIVAPVAAAPVRQQVPAPVPQQKLATQPAAQWSPPVAASANGKPAWASR